MRRSVKYAKTSDGVRVAYFHMGDGPPIVFASNVFGDAHFYRSLHPHTRRMTDGLVELGWSVVRYDLRGMGASGRIVSDMSQDALVRDLEAVIGGLGLRRFALAGLHCGAATAVQYAARHQGQVSQLILLNPFRSGARRFEVDLAGRTVTAIASIAEDDWAYFTLVAGNLVTKFANPEHARDLAAIFQRSTSPATHLAYLEAMRVAELTALLPRLEVPALIVHDTGFPFGAFEECEEIAKAMPNARLVVVPGDGAAEIAAIDSFLRSARDAAVPQPPTARDVGDGERHLTPREIEVVRLVAQGKTNREIAAALVLSERTVARHLTNIYQKLALRSKAEATAYAIHRGLA